MKFFLTTAEKAERQKNAEEAKWESAFETRFGFPAVMLSGANRSRYEREIMLRLGTQAKDAHQKAARYTGYPSLTHLEESYEAASNQYLYMLHLIEHFARDFAENMPHWTEFPAHLEKWLDGVNGNFKDFAPDRPRLVSSQ